MTAGTSFGYETNNAPRLTHTAQTNHTIDANDNMLSKLLDYQFTKFANLK